MLQSRSILFFKRFIKYKYRNLAIALVVPIIYIMLGIGTISKFGDLSLRHGDPDYIYLYSGVSMGNLRLNVGHIDNPGTPLQIIVGLVTRTVHLFVGKGPYTEDVLNRPDFYLQKVIAFNYLLCGMFLFILGFKTSKYLKRYYTPLIQLSLLLSWSVFYNTTTVIPEVIMIIPVSLLLMWFLRIIHENSLSINYLDIIKLAAIAGFGTSIKLDYFPLFLLPVFLINDFKKQAMYWPLAFLFFLVFAFPILNKRFIFIDWVTGLLTHSGKYGLGEEKFLDWPSFFENLKSLYSFYKGFFNTLFVFIATFLLSLFKTKYINYDSLKARITLGIILTALVHVFIVSKHFGLLYIVPLLYLTPFILILLIEYISITNTVKAFAAYLVAILLFSSFYSTYSKNMGWKTEQLLSKKITEEKVRERTSGKPLLIVDQPYNFYLRESPLLFGWFFQGNFKKVLIKPLTKLYPSSYVFDNGLKKFIRWNDILSFDEVLQEEQKAFMFINKKSSQYPQCMFLDTLKYNISEIEQDQFHILYSINTIDQ